MTLHIFANHTGWVHKIMGLCLQLLGGVLILWSVNDNLGLFRKTSLVGAFVAWLRDFPTRQNHVVMAEAGMVSVTGSAAVLSVGKREPTTIEKRLAELEAQLQAVRAEVKTQVAALANQIESNTVNLSSRIRESDGKISSLSERVEKATVGGFKLQAFGVLLAVYGAVTSVLA